MFFHCKRLLLHWNTWILLRSNWLWLHGACEKCFCFINHWKCIISVCKYNICNCGMHTNRLMKCLVRNDSLSLRALCVICEIKWKNNQILLFKILFLIPVSIKRINFIFLNYLFAQKNKSMVRLISHVRIN